MKRGLGTVETVRHTQMISMSARRLAIAIVALPLFGCATIFTPASISEAEIERLETDPECRNASPGNRLPGFRCRGDYDSFDM